MNMYLFHRLVIGVLTRLYYHIANANVTPLWFLLLVAFPLTLLWGFYS